jgi:hypothetical protein
LLRKVQELAHLSLVGKRVLRRVQELAYQSQVGKEFFWEIKRRALE